MKLFGVTKRSLDFGIGDTPPEWSQWVQAESIEDVKKLLDRYGVKFGVSVEEINPVGIGLGAFENFLRKNAEPVDNSRSVSVGEVEDMLGKLAEGGEDFLRKMEEGCM